MVTPLEIGAFAGLSRLLDYLRPARSPYLVGISAAGITLLFSLGLRGMAPASNEKYFIVPVLAFIVVFAVVPIAFFMRAPRRVARPSEPEEDDIDIEEQFKFSRSIFISIVIISTFNLVYRYQNLDWVFFTTYSLFIVNFVTFSGYLLARELVEESTKSKNLIQIALINSIFIFLLSNYASQTRVDDGSIWFDCHTSVAATVPGSESDEIDENGRTPTTLVSSRCGIGEQQLVQEWSSTYADIIIAGQISTTTTFSFNFLVHIVILILGAIYYAFWLFRIGSVIKIKIRE